MFADRRAPAAALLGFVFILLLTQTGRSLRSGSSPAPVARDVPADASPGETREVFTYYTGVSSSQGGLKEMEAIALWNESWTRQGWTTRLLTSGN
jgi:hypothetical protein